MQNHYHTIVVGAGAAGLMAARELSASGKKILILEARDRIGGRIHTISHDGLFLESGAEFIHGHLLLTMELLKRAGIEYCRISGEMEMSTEGDELEETEEPTDHWGELMRKMGKLETDMTVRDFLDLYFPGKKYEALRKSVTGFAQGFDLADLQNASTLAIYEEWKNEPGDQYRIRGGYSLLMAWLADECIKNGCELMLNQEVNQVRWARGQVSVGTLQNFSIQAEKILVTVPLSLLQGDQKKGSIRFDPLLTHHMKWFNAIGYGSVIKMILSFKNPFWEAKSKEMGFIISDQPVPTWWTQGPDRNNYLTGWLGGPPARNFPKDSDAALNDALQSLAAIFKLSLPFLRKELKSYHLFNWENEPYSFGAYSYAMPETTEARKQLNQSVDNTIFFAGEALHGGEMPGTVEAALMSGKEAAHKING